MMYGTGRAGQRQQQFDHWLLRRPAGGQQAFSDRRRPSSLSRDIGSDPATDDCRRRRRHSINDDKRAIYRLRG